MTRVGAVQICPEWNDQVLPMPATAPLTSPSSNTTAAPLPPSSSNSRFMPRPAVSAMRCPTGVLPVNDTMSMSASTSACPASAPEPVTTLNTPGGSPASSTASANRSTASGSCGAGFTTTVLPMASAGATLPAMLVSGKLYGVMHATTPTGCRAASPPMSPPLASAVLPMTLGGSG